MKFAVILAQPCKLFTKVKIYIVAVLNSPDSIKNTFWLKSYSLSKSNSSQICQFPIKILIFSKRPILGLIWRLFGGPNWKFDIQTNIKTLSRSEIFYSGVPKDPLRPCLNSQHPTPTPAQENLIFMLRSGCPGRPHSSDPRFWVNFWIFAKTRHKAATSPQTLLLAKNIDPWGFKSVRVNKKYPLAKKLCSPKVTPPTTKKHLRGAPPGCRFSTLAVQKSKILKVVQGVADADISDPGSSTVTIETLFLVWRDSASFQRYMVRKSSMVHIRVFTHRGIFSRTHR